MSFRNQANSPWANNNTFNQRGQGFQNQSMQNANFYNSIGTVTDLNNDCGLVNNEVFFTRNVCRGQLPQLGDRVVFEATLNQFGQFKWHATIIQLLSEQANQSFPNAQPLMSGRGYDKGSPRNQSSTWRSGAGGTFGNNQLKRRVASPDRDIKRRRSAPDQSNTGTRQGNKPIPRNAGGRNNATSVNKGGNRAAVQPNSSQKAATSNTGGVGNRSTAVENTKKRLSGAKRRQRAKRIQEEQANQQKNTGVSGSNKNNAGKPSSQNQNSKTTGGGANKSVAQAAPIVNDELKFAIIDESQPGGKIFGKNQSLVKDALNDALANLILEADENTPEIAIARSNFARQIYRITVASLDSVEPLRKVVENLPELWEGSKLKLVGKDEVPTTQKASFYLRASDSKRSDEEILKILARQNRDLKVDLWHALPREKRASGEVMILAIDQESLNILEKNNGRAFFLGSSVFINTDTRKVENILNRPQVDTETVGQKAAAENGHKEVTDVPDESDAQKAETETDADAAQTESVIEIEDGDEEANDEVNEEDNEECVEEQEEYDEANEEGNEVEEEGYE